MCGITGIIAFTEEGKKYLDKIDDAVNALHHRGPDGSGVFHDHNVALGHARLAIIDTTNAAAQPFTSGDDRYTIVFNGEIFNYQELRAELEQQGYSFRSHSDTEVLLTLYAKEGKECLHKLNGFFAFAVYDKTDGSLFIARDRFGEKPLFIATVGLRRFRQTEDYRLSNQNRTLDAQPDLIAFASEPKAFHAMGIKGSFETEELASYIHFNYLPSYNTFFYNFRRFDAGCYAKHSATANNEYGKWYSLSRNPRSEDDYETARATVHNKLDLAVQRRLIADVPTGSFLSGGVDSSVVSALAAKHKAQLQTFSIGYADEKYFDETPYAELVSKHIGSKHHVFLLTNKDLLESVQTFFENLDDPFADSSALAVNILARETKKHVTVALSGDGADELFAGYNKHQAEYFARTKGILQSGIKSGKWLWDVLPASRQSPLGNRIRQFRKFANVRSLSDQDRYIQWAGFTNAALRKKLLNEDVSQYLDTFAVQHMDEAAPDFNDVLLADFELVLQADMLVKVDRMSMLNGLEVRSPFLDHELVEYVMTLPPEYKINRHERKRILKDACRDLLPAEIFTRGKKGFEVPLLKWFRTDLRGMIDELLDEKFLKEQRLFNPEEVKNIRKQLHSNDPGDAAARIWGLIVFQTWWKKYIG